jgi:hypothetical protein
MDETIRRLERAYLADPTDLVAYEALLAARIRAGVPVDDPRTPAPTSVEGQAILLEARIRSGDTTRTPQQMMQAAMQEMHLHRMREQLEIERACAEAVMRNMERGP